MNMPNINWQGMAGSAELFIRKNGPTIAFGVGTAMVAAGSGIAIANSLKRKTREGLDDATVTEVHEHYANLRAEIEYAKQENPDEQKFYNSEIRKLYIAETKFAAKTYWLPAALMLGGFALSIGAYTAMGIRLAAMTSAYTKLAASNAALLEAAKNRMNSTDEEPIDIPEGAYTSNPKYDIDPAALTGMPYSYWFCADQFNGKPNPRWSNSMDSNFTIVNCAFDRLNDRLYSQGYLYLNSLLESLKMPLVPEGYQVGWIYSLQEDVQNQIDVYAKAYLIEDGKATPFYGDEIPEGADVRMAVSVVPDGAIDSCVYSRLFGTK